MVAQQTQAIDQAAAEAFAGKVLGDLAGVTNTALTRIGDRLGLFKSLAGEGAATSEELAERTGTNERYVREWLAALASAGYLTYDPATTTFTLPAEHALILAQEGGPMFLGGISQQFMGLLTTLHKIEDAFRNVGGVANDEFDADTWDGMSRLTATWTDNNLVQNWLPQMPDVRARLERGALLADIGSGYGQAVIKLAQAFPNSRFVGYDINERSLA